MCIRDRVGYVPDMNDTTMLSAKDSNSNPASAATGKNLTMIQLTAAPIDGLSIQADAANTSNETGVAVSVEEGVSANIKASYTNGPVSIGYQTGGSDTGVTGAAELATAAKAYTTATGNFEFEKISIAANVSDNMSISWGELTETYDAQSATVANVDMKSTSIQFAYSMGSMKFSGYMTDTDNPGWDSDANSDEVTELAVGLSLIHI